MKSAQIMDAIAKISMIADTQAKLVEADNASPAHTALVLREIVERCGKLRAPTFDDFEEEIDDELRLLVDGAVGFCEATGDEQNAVWERLIQNTDLPWKQNGGPLVTIGYLDGRPVAVHLSSVEINHFKVIFYEATSTVVDHDMVRRFIEKLAPDSAKRGGRLNHTDSTNFSNILPMGWANA